MKKNLTRIYLLGLFLVAIAGNVLANEGGGIIKGKVSTSDGRSAEGVTVELKGKSRGAITNEDGSFTIKNLNAGTYELTISLIGYQTLTETISVTDNETQNISIQLQLTKKELDAVIVKAGPTGYKNNATSNSLRITTPLLELPQNIQIISNKTISDQQVISTSDGLLRNVSGTVRLEHWGDMYAQVFARGSQVSAFRNGFSMANSYWGPLTEDMSFVDHVEFVKGPAGFMLSNGDPAGLYNVVTKKPTGQTKGEASITMGSYDLYRTTLDLDGKLSKDEKLLYRLNLSGQQKKTHRPNEYNDRYAIAPVVSYQLDEKTLLTAEYVWQNARMSNVGSYYIFDTRGYGLQPIDATLLPASLPATTINDHTVSVNLQHQLSTDWKFTAQVMRNYYRMDGTSMWPTSVSNDGKIIRNVSSWDAKSSMTMAQAFVNGDITTGKVRHRILGGIDVGTKEYFADWNQGHNLDSVGGEYDIFNPTPNYASNGMPHFDYSLPLEERTGGPTMYQRVTGLYLQDELGFFDNKLRVTLAGRYTRIKSGYYGSNEEADRFTPRIGLSYSVDKNTSVYALYDQSFLPQSGVIRSGAPVHAITGSNMEVGIKKDWFGGSWNTTVAVYRIMKQNELTSDPNDSTFFYSIELGEKRSQGVEFDLRGRLAPGLNLVLNYAYTDNVITKLDPSIKTMAIGDAVAGFAKHTANAWLSYKAQSGFLKGTGISAGFTYLADRQTYWDKTPTGGETLNDYFKLDAGLFWEKDRIRLTANVFNVLNDYLYSGSYYAWLQAYYYQTDPPRNLRFSVSYKF